MLDRSKKEFGSGLSPSVGHPSGILEFASVISGCRRHARLVVALTGLGLLLGVLYLTIATPKFASEGALLIDSRKNQLLEGQQVQVDPQLDVGLVESQIEILQSSEVLNSVVDRLHLTTNPEFNGSKKSILGLLLSLLPSFGEPNGSESDPKQIATKVLKDNLAVKRVGASYVLSLAYTSYSPVISANVVNTLAAAYISGEIKSKYEATRNAALWLEGRIKELKQQAAISDEAVQDFKSRNNIIDTNRGLISEQQLSDMNAQLLQANAASAEASARLDQIKLVLSKEAMPDASVADALHSDVINRLQAQYLDLASKERDLAKRYGKGHRVVMTLLGQMSEIKRSISDEMNRIAETYKSDFAVASARAQAIRTSLDRLVNHVGEDSMVRVKLRDLESTAQAYRTLYDSYLQKFSQATQQQTVPESGVRIITYAKEPQRRSSPKTALALGGGVLAGLLAGIGTALFKEFSKNTLKTAEEVRMTTGYRCLGVLPLMSDFSSDSDRIVVDAPLSRFSETLRNVKIEMDAGGQGGTIGIVSSLPHEGKTTVASNLASLLAGSGNKTLLIDADIRKPDLTNRLPVDGGAELGLIDVLQARSSLADAAVAMRENLDFLPCRVEPKSYDSSKLLSSAAMVSLLREANSHYNFVVVDFAPLTPVVDVKAVSHLIDKFLFVVEWDRTDRRVVNSAIAENEGIQAKLVGIVLNRADPRALRHYERPYGEIYHEYYT